MTGTLYLLPNLLCPEAPLADSLPANIHEIVQKLDGVICESEKPARRFLSHFKRASLPMKPLNEHTDMKELPELLTPLLEGKNIAILSDAGVPCIADPGAELVRLARKKKIPIQAIVGPSSIFLALMLSGLGGQRFAFHGYLPREAAPRGELLRKLEQHSRKNASTELFIEAPYRNQELLKALVEVLEPSTELALATDLTAVTESVIVKSIAEFRKEALPEINKRPTVFLFRAR